jgi:hypothetical protein
VSDGEGRLAQCEAELAAIREELARTAAELASTQDLLHETEIERNVQVAIVKQLDDDLTNRHHWRKKHKASKKSKMPAWKAPHVTISPQHFPLLEAAAPLWKLQHRPFERPGGWLHVDGCTWVAALGGSTWMAAKLVRVVRLRLQG